MTNPSHRVLGENKKPKMEEMAKKERKKQRRMQKDNYEMSAKAKELWNALRRWVAYRVRSCSRKP